VRRKRSKERERGEKKGWREWGKRERREEKN
jgi:hypothetical protein